MTKTNIRPLRDWLVVEPDAEPTETPAGILLLPHVDDGLVKRVVMGVVRAVGPRLAEWGVDPDVRIAYSPAGAVRLAGGLALVRRESLVGVLP